MVQRRSWRDLGGTPGGKAVQSEQQGAGGEAGTCREGCGPRQQGRDGQQAKWKAGFGSGMKQQ